MGLQKRKAGKKLNRQDRKWFLSTVKRTIVKYAMLQEGDRVALGVSGGKDSSVLLYILSLVRAQAPFPFSLQAIFVDLGWEMDISPLKNYCSYLQVPFHQEKTFIKKIVFDLRQEKNPCALCAKLRRGALHKAARDLGCNRVALGHHLDDVIQTFFLNLIFSGRMETFKPCTYLDRRDLYLIRPLVGLTQRTISSLARRENLPEIKTSVLWPGKRKGRKSVHWWILLQHAILSFTKDSANLWKRVVSGLLRPLFLRKRGGNS